MTTQRRIIASGTKWEDIVGYSRAVRTGNLVFVSGTTATNEAGERVGDDAYTQTKFILQKIERALNEAGADMRHVVRTTIYVTDASIWEGVGRAHHEFFADVKPANTLVEISALIGDGYLVEISADAVIHDADKPNKASFEQIYNLAVVDETLASAGQPRAYQFPAIKEAGYDVIINIDAEDTGYHIDGETNIVNELGFTYEQVPVLWEAPTQENVDAFFSTMDKYVDSNRFVHCVANWRASAMIMLYRVIKQNEPLDEVRAWMLSIWNPHIESKTWVNFINDTLKRFDVEGTI
ncbi:MAG: Rid family hydrolase [Chloroflexota bacterium]